MMSALRRWLGLDPSVSENERAQWRQDQYKEIQKGLHEAAARVHYLEMESELKSRGIFRSRERRSEGS